MDDDRTRHRTAAARWPANRATALAWSVVAGVVALLVVEAWYPFDLRRPQWTRTAPVRAGGTVAFDGSSLLRSSGAQPWVADARSTSRLRIAVELRADRADQSGPARVLTVSRDYGNSDVTIGQDGGDLIVRLRRPASGPVGEPAFRVAGLPADRAWHRVELTVEGGRARIVTDGRTAVDAPLGARPLAGWDPSYTVALGDEPHGDRGWRGEVRVAEVAVPGRRVDLLDPAVLQPGHGRIASRTQPLWQALPEESPIRSLARLLPFALLAATIQWRWRRTRWTLAAVCSLAVVLYAGKVFAAGRHATLSDVLLGLLGGLLGYLAVGALDRARAQTTLKAPATSRGRASSK